MSYRSQPQDLVTFRKVSAGNLFADTEIPERSENRRATNLTWLIIFVVSVLGLIPFLIYTYSTSAFEEKFVNYDMCGNVCGHQNYQWDDISCSGKDMTEYPYLEYVDMDAQEVESWKQKRNCVKDCQSGRICTEIESDRIDEDEMEPIVEKKVEAYIRAYLISVKWQITTCCLLSILVSVGMLFFFRYAVAGAVWSMLIACFVGLFAIIIESWYTGQGFNYSAICATVAIIMLAYIVTFYRNKIRLVIALLGEATKALTHMPGLTAIGVICAICILFLVILLVFVIINMDNASTLEHWKGDFYVYVTNPVILFTMAYLTIVCYWTLWFFTGIQYMIIAGAVSNWYFTRDKNSLGSPIMASVYHTFHFHLGTVALGAVIITIMRMIQICISIFIENRRLRALINFVFGNFLRLFEFLTKNAYIMTAMHGQELFTSGRRACMLIRQNIGDVISVNYILNLVLLMAQILIVIISYFLSGGIFYLFPSNNDMVIFAYIIILIFALVAAIVLIDVIKTSVDTILICYCEDKLLNNGMDQPYFMSQDLEVFIEKSKQIYVKK